MSRIFSRIFDVGLQVDSEGVAHAFLPEGFPDDFAELKLPFFTIATDYYAWREVVFSSGSLRLAIAASMAIPSLFRPVAANGTYFMDGGVTNPLPLAHVAGKCDVTIGIDVQRSPDPTLAVRLPNLIDAAGAQLMATQVIDHVAAAKTISPAVEGRIVLNQ